MIINRKIGEYTGPERGPLLVVLGAMHGNEPAGVQALDLLFKMLELEPITNPDFTFRGRMVGLIGNTRAFSEKERYIEQDLNRLWIPSVIDRIFRTDWSELGPEEKELRELLGLINEEIDRYQPERFILLDLHTTTAHGGIFSIASDDPESIGIALELHAPVIKGMLKGIQGTTLHYFNDDNFEPRTVAISFEAGQHNDPLSVNRSIAAITNCLRTIGCVDAEDVENRHDELLIEYSRSLPKVAELLMCHTVQPEDEFRMAPNYKNFQPVHKGELLAHDRNGYIFAQSDGRILMPLYQKQGNDGFFLIREVEHNGNRRTEELKN